MLYSINYTDNYLSILLNDDLYYSVRIVDKQGDELAVWHSKDLSKKSINWKLNFNGSGKRKGIYFAFLKKYRNTEVFKLEIP